MKIAAVTDDGNTISQHFGRAQYYLVATVKNGEIVSRELRKKPGHAQFANDPHPVVKPGQPHGMDPDSHNRHLQMVEAIADCQVLLARGMGMGAHDALTSRGIQPILTDIQEILPAVKAYIDGQLVDHPERLH